VAGYSGDAAPGVRATLSRSARMLVTVTPIGSLGALLVLAGGEGRRLDAPKAWIDFAGRPLLLHVLDRLAPLATTRPIVVARPRQPLPPGPYRRVDDTEPGAGPLAGLAAGLGAVERAASRVAVSACDYPFADPALFRALHAADREADVVVPRGAGHLHPLQAVWRSDAGPVCAALLAEGERRVRFALARLTTRVIEARDLEGVDPDRALLNVNVPAELDRARGLARSGDS